MSVLVDTSVWSLALRRKGPTAFSKVARHLDPFPLLDLGRRDFVAAASLHRVCASTGVSASTADCQIAAAAIRHECLLLTADRDFDRIARLSPLKLA